jgi:CRISPR/Cas system-associated protein Cas7 (RAMP superfamily)
MMACQRASRPHLSEQDGAILHQYILAELAQASNVPIGNQKAPAADGDHRHS